MAMFNSFLYVYQRVTPKKEMGPASVGNKILDYLVKEMPPGLSHHELPMNTTKLLLGDYQSGDNPMKPGDRPAIFSMIITIWL